MPGMPENASLRVAVESLRNLPQVKIGVDYFTQLINTFKTVKMPADFKYSEINSEQIDDFSLNYIDVTSGNNKKRMYVMIRKGYAVTMTISYYEDADFQALHKVLTVADLDYKN